MRPATDLDGGPQAPCGLLPDEGRQGLQTYLGHGGYRALRSTLRNEEQLREILRRTRLTGLGGAHFPLARKIDAILLEAGECVVVCNAAEDEPGSRKDRTLLECNPHVVLEGLLLAASAVGAAEAYLYVSAHLSEALTSIRGALEEASDTLPIDDIITVRVVQAPGAYVAGEGTAALEVIEGRDPRPRFQPPYPTRHGLQGRPTLISNTETLANLPRLVLSHLDRDLTPLSAPPTRLVTVTGDVVSPGVFEVPVETSTLRSLVELAGGTTNGDPVKAVQPGGPSSAYLPGSALDTQITVEAIAAAGSQSGCLAVRVITSRTCIVEDLSEITGFFAREQCGQCPPCRMKTQTYHKIIEQVRCGKGKWRLLKQFAGVDEYVADMPARCALISMPGPPVESAIRLFPEDFAKHIDEHSCAAA